MSLIGESVTIVKSPDLGFEGRRGRVVLETANTLLIADGGLRFTVAKKGVSLRLGRSGETVEGDSISGRLEDRLEAKRR